MKIGLFAGSFDPFTIGHANIVERALDILYDQVHILISNNVNKTRMFSHEEIEKRIKKYYDLRTDRVKVFVIHDRIVDYNLPEYKYSSLLRGIRDSADFDYEKQLTILNKDLTSLESVFLMTDPLVGHISSSYVREMIKYNKPYEKYII